MAHIKIKDVYGYVKDSHSKAVLAGKDNKELLAYKARKQSMKKLGDASERIDKMEKRIDALAAKLDMILSVLINKNESGEK